MIDEKDIIKLLNCLGSDVCKENDNEIIFFTICHNKTSEESSPKLYYYKDSKRFKCFSNCGNMSLFDLIIKINNCTFSESVKYVEDTLNLGINKKPKRGIGSYKPSTVSNIKEVVLEKLPTVQKPYVYRIFNDCCIPQWEDEGISHITQNKYDIRLDIEKNRILIPHFDIDDRIVGVRTRLLDPILSEKYGKYLPLFYDGYGYNHRLSMNLYGINKTKENIKRKKKAFVFEGEKSVLKFEDKYPDNNIAVATCGSSFSKYQKKILLDLGVNEITICFDRQFKELGDEDCIAWWDKIENMSKDLIDIIDVYVIWDTENLLNYKDSPIDASKDAFEKLLKNRIKVGD